MIKLISLILIIIGQLLLVRCEEERIFDYKLYLANQSKD